MSKRIAVVGVGLMGSSLARHLLAAGFAVTVHDLDPAKVQAIVKEGAKEAGSPDRIASQASSATCSDRHADTESRSAPRIRPMRASRS